MSIRSTSPQLNASPLVVSLQLLGWLFFRPSAWRDYVRQIDPALPPHFCLAQLTDAHWQHPLLRRLLVHGYVALPILSGLFVSGGLAASGQLTSLAITGLFFGLGAGLLLGTAVSVAAGLVAAVAGSAAFAIAWSGTHTLWFDLVTTSRMGIIYGVITAVVAYVLLNIGGRRDRVAFGRQTGSFVIGFLASLAITVLVISVTTVTVTTGERGGLGNRGIGLVIAGIAGSLFGLTIGWRTSSQPSARAYAGVCKRHCGLQCIW